MIGLEDLRVVVTTPIPSGTGRGFAPVTVDATNDGSRPARLELYLDAGRYNMTRYRQEWTLDVPPGESVSKELLVCIDRSGRGGSYRLYLRSGRELSDVRLELFDGRFDPTARVIAFVGPSELSEIVLAARRTDLPLDSTRHEVRGVHSESLGGSRGAGSVQAARLVTMAFDDLPKSAAGWSDVDTVFVDARMALPANPRWERLLEWAQQGGQLAFVGGDLERSLRSVPVLDGITQERYRLGVPEEVLTADFLGASSIDLYSAGFGTVALCAFESPDDEFFSEPTPMVSSSDAMVRTLQAFDGASLHATDWPSSLGAIYASSGQRIQEPWTAEFPEAGLPVRSVLGLLTLFAIIVGPISVLYARRKGQPGLLLVAVPLISLVSTVVIVGYGMLRQGFGTEGYAHSLSIVDQVEKRATSALRRELVMGRGGQTLQPLPSTTVLVPERNLRNQTRTMEQDGNQFVLSGDFLPVRTRTGHVTLATGATRARLEWMAPDGDTMSVTNALGVSLQMLEVMSPDGRVFAAEGEIGKGATATLRERTRASIEGVFDVAEHEPIFDAARLPRGGYLALCSEAGPGVDDASVEMEELKYLHGIVGYLDTDPTKWSR